MCCCPSFKSFLLRTKNTEQLREAKCALTNDSHDLHTTILQLLRSLFLETHRSVSHCCGLVLSNKKHADLTLPRFMWFSVNKHTIFHVLIYNLQLLLHHAIIVPIITQQPATRPVITSIQRCSNPIITMATQNVFKADILI